MPIVEIATVFPALVGKGGWPLETFLGSPAAWEFAFAYSYPWLGSSRRLPKAEPWGASAHQGSVLGVVDRFRTLRTT